MMAHQREEIYVGKLSYKSASEGMLYALTNSLKLLEDAQLLYDNNRFERAFALAVLAIEEFGKIPIIRGIILEDDLTIVRKKWYEYRRHLIKNRLWTLRPHLENGKKVISTILDIFSKENVDPQTLDRLKQYAFYTDINIQGVWIHPEFAITRELAVSILKIADGLIPKKLEYINTEDGMKKYVEFMRPHMKKTIAELKPALIEFYGDLEKSGLCEKGTTEYIINNWE